jgi:hypothetical protein
LGGVTTAGSVGGAIGTLSAGTVTGTGGVTEYLLPISTPNKKRRIHRKQKHIAMIAIMRWVKVKVYCITLCLFIFMGSS